MKFIDLSTTVSVNADFVEYVASENNGATCIVYFSNKEYPCALPYLTVLRFLKEEPDNKTMSKLDKYLSVATVTQV